MHKLHIASFPFFVLVHVCLEQNTLSVNLRVIGTEQLR